MKFISSLLLFLIIFSAIESHRLRNKHKHKFRKIRNNGGNLSLLYQFTKACVLELAKVPDTEIDKCLPDSWKSAKPGEEDKEGAEGSKEVEEQKTGWYGILDKLGKFINYVCSIKDVVKSIIEFFTKNGGKRYRRMYRLFYQGKSSTLMAIKWSFSSFVDGAKNIIKSGADAIKNGAIKIKNAVAEAGQNVEEFITKTIKEKIAPIVDMFEAIKAKVVAFTKNPIIQKLITFYNCLKTFKGLAAGIVSIITSWITLIGELSTPAGWVKLVIKLICAWEELAKAIGYLKEAFAPQVTAPIKWQKIGQFVGKLIYTIGNSDD